MKLRKCNTIFGLLVTYIIFFLVVVPLVTAIGAALIIVLISLLPKFLYFCFDSHLHHHYVGLRFWVYHISILSDYVCQVELLPWLHWSGLQLVVMYVSIVVVTFLVRVHPVICHTSPVPGYKFICATFISLTVLRTLILCCIFCILCTPEFVSGAFISEDRSSLLTPVIVSFISSELSDSIYPGYCFLKATCPPSPLR